MKPKPSERIALDLLFDELDMRKADPAGDEELVRDVIARCRDAESRVTELTGVVERMKSTSLLARAEKAEARVKELEEFHLAVALASGIYHEADYHAPEPGDDASIIDAVKRGYDAIMRAADDAHTVYVATQRAEKAEDAYDKLRMLQDDYDAIKDEPACLFSETVKVDVRGGHRTGVEALNLKRFINHHCRITVEALYPIGAPVEGSKPEGRDS